MNTELNKKRPRTFQCRDGLWQKFEQMARELECSVDYLINDAMKQYARQRGYTGQATESPPASSAVAAPPPPAPPPPARAASGAAHVPPPPTSGSGALPLPPPPPPPPAGRSMGAPPPPAPAPGGHRGFFPTPGPGGRPGSAPPGPSRRPGPPLPPAPTGSGRVSSGPPAARPSGGLPPPMPRGASTTGPRAPAPAPASTLGIYYQGERFAVNKERFIIGRGKQSSDLTIKDPNVSRQHAMIEFVNGQYFIVDMGSTNGIEYNGQRVQRKAISEGDIFKVCDHELHFSFS